MAELPGQDPKELRKEGGVAVLECGLCEGTGGDPIIGGKCPVCGGRAIVRITEPYIRCNHCRGYGVQYSRSGFATKMTCIVCKGKGVVYVSGTTKECGACEGTGRHPSEGMQGMPCAVCSGKGFVAA